MAKILLVEDDVDIRRLLSDGLATDGHDVDSSATALDGLKAVVDLKPDLVILDLGLPDLDGSELLRMIRAVSNVPILIATARDDDDEIVALLDAGADDFVTKPFSVEQVEARARAILRRSEPTAAAPELVVGPLFINLDERSVRYRGSDIEMTPKEFDLLAYLAGRPDRVVSKREILAEVWRQPYGGSDRTVDVHVSWIRKKLGESAEAPILLHTVRGVGLKLVHPDE